MSITVQPGIAKQAVIMKRRVGERIAEYVGSLKVGISYEPEQCEQQETQVNEQIAQVDGKEHERTSTSGRDVQRVWVMVRGSRTIEVEEGGDRHSSGRRRTRLS